MMKVYSIFVFSYIIWKIKNCHFNFNYLIFKIFCIFVKYSNQKLLFCNDFVIWATLKLNFRLKTLYTYIYEHTHANISVSIYVYIIKLEEAKIVWSKDSKRSEMTRTWPISYFLSIVLPNNNFFQFKFRALLSAF